MIGGCAEATDDGCVRAGIERRAGDDLLEEVGRYPAGAGEGREQASGPKQLQREEIDVLVGAGGLRRVVSGGRELRGIEDDEVETGARVAQAAQLREDVGVAPFGAGAVEAVVGDVRARERQRVARAVDRDHRSRAAGKGGDRESARVAEAVEDVAIAGERADASAVVALIEEEPRFLDRKSTRLNSSHPSISYAVF